MESGANDVARSAADRRALRAFWSLIAVACVATLIAAIAGLVLGIAEPDRGTTSDDVSRSTAAVAGLAAGVLFGLAAIWAQVKNLWRFAPRWFRYVAWGLLAVIAIAAAASSAARSG